METEATSPRMVAERWSYKLWLHGLRGGMLVGRGDAGGDRDAGEEWDAGGEGNAGIQ